MNTNEKLAELVDMMDHVDVLEINKKELIEATIPQEVRITINDIEFEFGEKISALRAEIEKMQAEVKEDVIRLGGTVKSQYMMAVYNKGRESWDSGKLDGMAVLIPDILKAKKIGEPSVTLRRTSGG